MMTIYSLPRELQCHIYSFDPTYRAEYDVVMMSLKYRELEQYLHTNYDNIEITDCDIVQSGDKSIITFTYDRSHRILFHVNVPT